MASVGGGGAVGGSGGDGGNNVDEIRDVNQSDAEARTNSVGSDNTQGKTQMEHDKVSSPVNRSSSLAPPFTSVPQVFGMGTGNRDGLRLSLENSLGGVSGGKPSSAIVSHMLTTPTMPSSSTSLSPGSLLLPPTLLTPGTLNLLSTPTSSLGQGLVASSPAGAPTLTTPTLTPTTLKNIEQMFLEHDELGGFGVSGQSAGSHENAAHFVPPPVTDFSTSLKEEVDEINEAAPGVGEAMASSTSGNKTILTTNTN